MMLDRLRFRRQFLLCKNRVDELADWSRLEIGSHVLHVHPDLEVGRAAAPGKDLVLIGNIFSPADPEKSNAAILQEIVDHTAGLNDFFRWIKRFAGKYVLIFRDNKDFAVLNDALSLREIYYCTGDNQVLCGSQPDLIKRYADPGLRPRSDPDFAEYYAKNSVNSRWDPRKKWIGDETFFEGLKHLLPNHYLDPTGPAARRYWPREPIKRVALDEAVEECGSFLRGSIAAIANRHPVMMAVTAGTDSRTLLSASKLLRERIYYFINDQGLGPHHPDVSVPQRMFDAIGIPFHVHHVPAEVDPAFREIFLSNTFFSSERILPTIYNVYYKEHQNKVNLLGIGEIGRTRFGKEPKKLDGYRIAYKLGHVHDRYARSQGERILSELGPVGKQFGVNVLTLLYWEHWLGNWGVTGNSESDIAIEEFDPYDSHKLYELFLGIEPRYANYYHPAIFKKMIENMWPELLHWPINPPHKTRDKITGPLKKTPFYPWLKEIKYRLNFRKYGRPRSG